MSLQISDIILDGVTSDPVSPVDGQMWYRSDLGEVKQKKGGTIKTHAFKDGITVSDISDFASSISANTTIVNIQSSLSGKQAILVSGTNIKSINGSSILGSGNLTVTATGLVPKGAWVSQNYVVGDAVSYTNGNSYICYLNTTSNQIPTNTTYWQILSEKGATGTVNYTETFDTITTTSGGAWVTRTLTNSNNLVVDILIDNQANTSRDVGVRAYGSTLPRLFSLGKQGGMSMLVKADGSGRIEIYSTGSDVNFRKIGNF